MVLPWCPRVAPTRFRFQEQGGGRQDAAQMTGHSLLQDPSAFQRRREHVLCGGELDAGPVIGRVGLGKLEGTGEGGKEKDRAGCVEGCEWSRLAEAQDACRGTCAGLPMRTAALPRSQTLFWGQSSAVRGF